MRLDNRTMPITSPVFASLGRAASNLLAAPREFPPPAPGFQELMRRPAELAGHSSVLSWPVIAGAFAIPIVRFIFRGLREFKSIAPSVKEGGGWEKVNRGTGKFEYYLGLWVRDAGALLLAPLILYLRYKGIGPVRLNCHETEAMVAGALGVFDMIHQVRVRREVNAKGKGLSKAERRAAKIQALGILGPDVKDLLPKGK